MTQLFEKVYINTEDDLPKFGKYIVMTDRGLQNLMYDPNVDVSKYQWKQYVNWYLLPVDRPDDEQIRQYVKDHEDQFSLTDFADWIIKNSHK